MDSKPTLFFTTSYIYVWPPKWNLGSFSFCVLMIGCITVTPSLVVQEEDGSITFELNIEYIWRRWKL